MKRVHWLLITLGTLLLASVVLPHAVKAGRPVRARSPRCQADLRCLKPQDPDASQAFERWRRSEPRHWRDCVIQH